MEAEAGSLSPVLILISAINYTKHNSPSSKTKFFPLDGLLLYYVYFLIVYYYYLASGINKLSFRNGCTNWRTHCWKCNIIFMPKRQYLSLRKEHRFLVANICEIGDDGYTPVADSKMKAESTLKLCGYSVDKDSPLSDLDRKDLLANIISNGILSRAEILQHLNHLILFNGSKDRNFSACCRWEEDYAYVSNLNIEDQAIVMIDEIQPYAKRNKRSE